MSTTSKASIATAAVTVTVPLFTGTLSYPFFAAMVYAALYGARTPDWANPVVFKVLFSFSFLLVNALSVSTSALTTRLVGAPVALCTTLMVVILSIVALPSLWVLGYYNNCLGLPGPPPFGGANSCG